jgi:hypothetical protein
MSGEAIGWAKKQACGGRGPKDVLKTLADYADENGFAWASISTLARECEASERTVQRDLRHLEDMGLLQGFDVTDARTGRSRTRLYWFPVQGGEPTPKMRKAIELERGARVTWVSPSEGDMGVTGEGDMGVTPGVTTVSPLKEPLIEPEEADASSQRGCAHGDEIDEVAGAIWSAWPEAGRLHSSERQLSRAVRREVRDGAALTDVQAGSLAYSRNPKAWGASGKNPKSPHNFVGEGCWKTHLPRACEGRATATPRIQFADAELRAALCAAMDEPWVVSWLDPCGWDEGKRVIDPRIQRRADKLREARPREVLAKLGVTVGRVG